MPGYVGETQPSDQHEATEIRSSLDRKNGKKIEKLFANQKFKFIICKYKLQIEFELYEFLNLVFINGFRFEQ